MKNNANDDESKIYFDGSYRGCVYLCDTRDKNYLSKQLHPASTYLEIGAAVCAWFVTNLIDFILILRLFKN